MSDTPDTPTPGLSIDRCIIDLHEIEEALRAHATLQGRGEIGRTLSAIATQCNVARLAIRGLRVETDRKV